MAEPEESPWGGFESFPDQGPEQSDCTAEATLPTMSPMSSAEAFVEPNTNPTAVSSAGAGQPDDAGKLEAEEADRANADDDFFGETLTTGLATPGGPCPEQTSPVQPAPNLDGVQETQDISLQQGPSSEVAQDCCSGGGGGGGGGGSGGGGGGGGGGGVDGGGGDGVLADSLAGHPPAQAGNVCGGSSDLFVAATSAGSAAEGTAAAAAAVANSNNSNSSSSNSAAETADILNDLWHNLGSKNTEEARATLNNTNSEAEKADNSSDDETRWGFVSQPGPETAATEVVRAGTPPDVEPRLHPSTLLKSSDASEAGGATPDDADAGESDQLKASIAPPPPPPSAGAGSPAVAARTLKEHDPPASSWANPAHGIWHRPGGDEPLAMNAIPAEKVDGEWVDLAAADRGVVEEEEEVSAHEKEVDDQEEEEGLADQQEDEVADQEKEEEEVVDEEEEEVADQEEEGEVANQEKDIVDQEEEGKQEEEGGEWKEQEGEEGKKVGEDKEGEDRTRGVDREERLSEQQSPTQPGGSLPPEAILEGGADSRISGADFFSGPCVQADAHADGAAVTEPVDDSEADFEFTVGTDSGPFEGVPRETNALEPRPVVSPLTERQDVAEVAAAAAPSPGGFEESLPASPEPETVRADLLEDAKEGGAEDASVAIGGIDWGNLGISGVGFASASGSALPVSVDAAETLGGKDADEVAWSPFDVPPSLSPGKNEKLGSPRPIEEIESVGATPAATEGSAEDGEASRSELPPSPPASEKPHQCMEPVSNDPGEADHVIGSQPDTVAGMPDDAWGAFDEAPGQNPLGEGAESAGLMDSIEDEKSPVSLLQRPDFEASDSWGAFHDDMSSAAAAAAATQEVSPPPSQPASLLTVSDAAAATGEAVVAVQPDEATADAAGKGSQPEVGDAEAAGAADGGDEPKSESGEEWSDFGDFEEAPTPEEAVTPVPEIALPKPASVNRSLPVLATTGGGKGGAAPEGGTGGTKSTGGESGVAPGAVGTVAAPAGAREGGAKEGLLLLPTSAQTLAVMVTVFDMAFSPGGSAAVPGKAMAGGDAHEESSLESMVDMAHVMRHAPAASRAPPRLNAWATACILRGIRPVPDALSLEESDEDVTASTSKVDPQEAASGPVHSEEPAVPAVSSPRSTNVGVGVGAQASPRSLSRPQPDVSPPPAVAAAVAAPGSATWASRVTPSSAPPPLPLKPTRPKRAEIEKKTERETKQEQEQEKPQRQPQQQQQQQEKEEKEEEQEKQQKKEQEEEEEQWQEAEEEKDSKAPVPAAAETTSFASFPSTPEPRPSDGPPDSTGWRELTPDMPRHPPPRLPSPPPSARDNRNDSNPVAWSGPTDNVADTSDGAVVLANDAATDGTGVNPGEDEAWDGDPFDDFQSAPPAAPPAMQDSPTTPPVDGKPSAPAETPAWNLDFFMAAPARGLGGGAGGAPGLLSLAGGETRASGEGESQSGKHVDLVSQALAGFGIAGAPDRESGQDTPHHIGDPLFPLSGPGRLKAGDGVAEGGAMHGSSVELSDLLRATRLRGGGKKGARARSPPLEKVSASAQARLDALPDLSFMLSARIRFPIRGLISAPSQA